MRYLLCLSTIAVLGACGFAHGSNADLTDAELSEIIGGQRGPGDCVLSNIPCTDCWYRPSEPTGSYKCTGTLDAFESGHCDWKNVNVECESGDEKCTGCITCTRNTNCNVGCTPIGIQTNPGCKSHGPIVEDPDDQALF